MLNYKRQIARESTKKNLNIITSFLIRSRWEAPRVALFIARWVTLKPS